MARHRQTEQHWALQSTADGYRTVTCVGSAEVIDVSGGSTADGAALIRYRDTGCSDQRCSFHRVTG